MSRTEMTEQIVSISYVVMVFLFTFLKILSYRVKALHVFEKLPWALLIVLWAPPIAICGLIVLGLFMLGNLH